jgi:multicomponent Na+:H+ antiporter subunit F
MSAWLAGAAVLVALLVPLGLAAAARTPGDGLVALQLAGTVTTVAVLLMAVGLGREPLGDLAVVLAVASFVGSLAYATILGRAP